MNTNKKQSEPVEPPRDRNCLKRREVELEIRKWWATKENKKKITLIETGRGRPQNAGMLKVSDDQFYHTNDTQEKAVSQIARKDKNYKRTRKDKEVLKGDIFALFSRNKFLSFKLLNDNLDQPDNFLKLVLDEICDYVKSGARKGMYTLKSEYVSGEN